MTLRINNLHAFSKIFGESFIAYSFDVGGVLAGFIFYYTIAAHYSVINAPWAIAIYPTILSAKGMIGGLLSGRLSTALHLGTVYPRFSGNTKSFYKLFESIIVITFATSVVMGLVSLIFGSLFWGITVAHFPEMLMVAVATMNLGLTISLVTVAVSFITFKKGFDPDVAVYPIMSTVADITITAFYVVVLNLFFFWGAFGKGTVIFLACMIITLAMYTSVRDLHDEDFLKTVKESFLTIILVSIIVNVTGTVLHRISEIIEARNEVYTVYPALIDMVGDVGSVVGSTATTKIALGLLKPTFSSIKSHMAQIFGAWIASILWFVILSSLSLAINGKLNGFLNFVNLLIITNLIAVSIIVLVSYSIAILTFHRGLDPDNFVIPIESSLADSVTSTALLIALFLTSASL